MNRTIAQAVVEINQVASKFESSIVIITDDKVVDAKSMLGLSFSILTSKSFKLEIHGKDEEDAKNALKEVFVKNKLSVEINK
ncbi:HPr family phosphocarrier protein [Metabacillus endolithicus]|uniref:HPr family phosphocarrier protein n=1 Tax=Metabacillus endolithicus TaxID=1535204 RepID=A0ABW5BZC0_9BACI|nr:HPr family phosphocarrier protein [Metabacillus endolithicus]UPG62506.1 HPr family phosphocarrier protein [Metabacillus endolithicus]